jgi:geranylgeranyl pyrophosphate synthase
MEWISTYKQDIEFAIDTFFKERYHREDVTEEEKKLREAVLYAVKSTFSGRIHPVLAMVVYEEVLGLTADTAIPVFIGLEFITISTRLHGELAGIKDPYKSPDISFVKKYGNTMTLLAGNALMSMGLECLSK